MGELTRRTAEYQEPHGRGGSVHKHSEYGEQVGTALHLVEPRSIPLPDGWKLCGRWRPQAVSPSAMT